jgi:hypothetical protein
MPMQDHTLSTNPMPLFVDTRSNDSMRAGLPAPLESPPLVLSAHPKHRFALETLPVRRIFPQSGIVHAICFSRFVSSFDSQVQSPPPNLGWSMSPHPQLAFNNTDSPVTRDCTDVSCNLKVSFLPLPL